MTKAWQGLGLQPARIPPGVPAGVEGEAWAPNAKGAQRGISKGRKLSPASPAGAGGAQQINRSWNGDRTYQPSGAASGAPPAVCEEEALSNFHFTVGNAGGGAAQGDLEVHGSNRCWGVPPDRFKIGPIGMRSGDLDHGKP